MDNINFTARYLNTVEVLKRNSNNKYIPHNVSLVEIDPKNKQDIDALQKVCNLWKGNFFCEDILDITKTQKKTEEKTLAIINQDKNSVEYAINYKNILGLATIKHNKYKTTVSYMEAVPHQTDTTFNHVGSSMIENIKNTTNKINLFCPSVNLINNFYAKLGFVSRHPEGTRIRNYGELTWDKDMGIIKKTYSRIMAKLFT